MPPHHPTRQLYPYPSNTTECLTSCSPDCLFYDLCHDPHPDPLPHPLPSLPTPQPSSTSIHLHHFPRLLLALLIPSALLVFISVLFVVLCLFYGYRRHRRILNQNHALAPLPVHINPPDLGPDSDQHYVWYIRTVGLDDSAIRAISARCYKAGDDGCGASMAGCTVCLGEFHEGELLRLLPKCGHAFHVSCIDTWLRAHASCPLCRAAVVVPPQNGFPLPPSSPSDTGDELSDTETLNLGDGSAIGNGTISPLSTLPVRRSASMGSIECKGENFDEGSASNSKELKSCVGFEVELVRSWSCGGDKFFLSRHGRG